MLTWKKEALALAGSMRVSGVWVHVVVSWRTMKAAREEAMRLRKKIKI